MVYLKRRTLRGVNIILRFLDRITGKMATFLEDGKFADVNWVYRRVNWSKFFRKRSWIDWVVARNTDVENE